MTQTTRTPSKAVAQCEGCSQEFMDGAPGSYIDRDGCNICPECAADLRATALLEGDNFDE